MMARHWWKLGLGTGLLFGTPAWALGQVLTPPAEFTPRPVVVKGKPIARGSLLHTANWPDTPLGYSVALHAETQIANAAASRMFLYDYDFVPGTSELNDRGKDRVLRIATLLPHNRFPVVVERLSYAPVLAEARRRTVLASLVAAAGAVPPERVVIGRPASVPLQGPESELIYMNLLRLTESAGTVPGTGVHTGQTTGGAGSGTGTGGFGTGGMR
jgi:hypothetical protein